MKSKVYFADLRAKEERNVPDRIASLLERAGLPEVIGRGGLVAVKMHFGEAGNTAFIRPVLVRRVISEIKRLGGSPFLTDTGTLYRGSRENAVKHIETATANGFAYSVVGAPLIIADGIRGIDSKRVEIDGVHHKRVPVARAIAEADALVVLSHFKCHELTGFGGALKNMGMGCTSREGKLDQHSTVSPHIDRDLCTGCESCIRKCG